MGEVKNSTQTNPSFQKQATKQVPLPNKPINGLQYSSMNKTQKDHKQHITQKFSRVRLFLTGFAMGSSDIVPGVSGGTVALILGVYERLIQSIKDISSISLKLFLQGKIKESIKSANLDFLIPLGLGLATAIVTLAKILGALLENQPQFVWSFFFGLVLASVWLVGRKVSAWGIKQFAGLIIGAIVAYLIVGAVPVQTPDTYLAFFLSGAIAIVAMILPGISGSFLLVVMGKYEQVLGAVTAHQFDKLAIFMLGAVVGISLFARILSWLFAHYHDTVMAILTGVMIGSLRKIWPWKQVLEYYTDRHGELTPLVEKNIIPSNFDSEVSISLVLFLLGLGIILILSKYGQEHSHAKNHSKTPKKA